MTSSSSPKDILDKLIKLKGRLKGKVASFPPDRCHSVDHHVAGMFLQHHMDYLIRLVREDAE